MIDVAHLFLFKLYPVIHHTIAGKRLAFIATKIDRVMRVIPEAFTLLKKHFYGKIQFIEKRIFQLKFLHVN